MIVPEIRPFVRVSAYLMNSFGLLVFLKFGQREPNAVCRPDRTMPHLFGPIESGISFWKIFEDFFLGRLGHFFESAAIRTLSVVCQTCYEIKCLTETLSNIIITESTTFARLNKLVPVDFK